MSEEKPIQVRIDALMQRAAAVKESLTHLNAILRRGSEARTPEFHQAIKDRDAARIELQRCTDAIFALRVELRTKLVPLRMEQHFINIIRERLSPDEFAALMDEAKTRYAESKQPGVEHGRTES